MLRGLKKRRWIKICLTGLAGLIFLLIFSGEILSGIGGFLVFDDPPVKSEAVVVLNTGMEYYPRLMEAADLYNQEYVKKIVINGNRKTKAYRELEKMGLESCCPWYEERVRILELYNVPRKDIITISAEDVYDTVSEAKAVGKVLIENNISKIIVTTSISHTGRANHIWKKLWEDQLEILTIAAHNDPYSMETWWKHGRETKIVLYEYGSWIFYLLKG